MPSFEQILKKSGDPILADRQWREFEPILKKFKKTKGLEAVVSLFGNSRPLVHYLLRYPEVALDIAQSPYLSRPKEKKRTAEELRLLSIKTPHTSAASMRALRHYRQREMIRIAARDLSGLATFEEVGREIASLADGLIEFALRSALRIFSRKQDDFAVIGLGKLGAEDLNVSSDVDLLYLHDSGKPDFVTRIGKTLTRLLQERTEDGFAFRVDLGLRPEGKAGLLVPSFDGITFYYQSMAAPWEHAALSRARFITGSASLGDDFIKFVHSLIFHRYRDTGVIHNLKEIKEKIREQGAKKKGFHVKLGVGGIREVEFFLQVFQLLYGGEEPSLRATHPLKILEAIRPLEKVPAEDLDGLKRSYIFLRRIENHLQRLDDSQVHLIPDDPEELLALARRMGLSSAKEFREELDRQTTHVHHCFEELLPH